MKKRILAFLISAATVMPLCCIGGGAARTNKAPTVIPAIREWNGGTGEFKLSDTVKINVKDATVSDGKKNIITESFSSYLGVDVVFAEEGGDIFFVTDKSDEELGKDGYSMEITENTITVKAPEDIGFLYGVYTILQSVKADG
jgi:hexosaminidase